MSLASKGVVSPPHPQGREMLTGCRAPSGQCVCVCVCTVLGAEAEGCGK